MAHLLPAGVLSSLRPAQAATLLGRSFFPRLIAAPFGAGLHTAFDFAAGGCAVAAIASWSRGKRYVYRPAVPASPAPGHGLGEGPALPETVVRGGPAPLRKSIS
jgi:hypothetical protein